MSTNTNVSEVRRRSRQFTSVAVAMLFLFGANGCSRPAASTSTFEEPELPVVTAKADLATGAEDLTQFTAKAGLLVTARAGTSRQTTDPRDPTLVYTHQEFTIANVIWGSPAKAGTVTVVFTGGVVDTAESKYMLQLEGQPQFDTGTQYLLALVGPTPQNEYFALGGSQGRYKIVEGALRAETTTGDRSPVESALDGQPLDKATATLKALRR